MKRCAILLVSAAVVVVSALGGCGTSSNLSRYSQAQLNAIETRTVEASLAETFQAASNALFDAGYTIAMSDREGGLITGQRGDDKTAERFWISPYIQDTRFIISIQVREQSSSQTDARIKTSKNGEPYVDEEAIDQIWTLMQRQVLMKAPLAVETN
jgi:hypothetical protein